jgi:hypothetical protein
MDFKIGTEYLRMTPMISERTDKCIHKSERTQALQFDECSHLGHMCAKGVGYVHCAPKYS